MESASRCRYCTGMFWLRNFGINPVHHGTLGICLRDSRSRTGNTLYLSDEDSGQPRSQLQTDFMTAHISHWTVPFPVIPGFYLHHPNPLPYNQHWQRVIVDLSALLNNHCAQDLIIIDPFWDVPIRLSSLIPPDFPLHIDSIRAESFSRLMNNMSSSFPSQGDLIHTHMLDIFRLKFISAYGGNIEQVPTVFSITRAAYFVNVPTQFGVSAPRSQSPFESQMADLVRRYRVRQCWEEQQPPQKSEGPGWRHGQCAESQSFSPVVAHCANLGLKNVTIITLAMNKSGKLVGMCGNCLSYVFLCVLRKHPTWKIFDAYTKKFHFL